jgi:hypothetical protein
MFIAVDKNGKCIEASEARRELQYYCPSCGNPVILKSGIQNTDHFAHIANECADAWNYDTSEWHIKMQGFFPTDAREVVIRHNGIVHRADVFIENTVIEMQHSPISAEEFNDRNEFFTSLGYRVVWVFDVRDKKYNNQIQYLDEDTSTKFKWSHPMRIFEILDKPLTDYDKSFAVYLDLYYEEYEDVAPEIYRIVWTKGNDVDAVDLSRFAICEEGIVLGDIEGSEDFFLSLKEKRKRYALKRIKELKEESEDKGFSYSIKYIGEKGKPKEAYTCDRRREFGLKWSGEKACIYCKHSALTITTKKDGKNICAIYCCYPYVYREPDEDAHPGYECFRVEELKL